MCNLIIAAGQQPPQHPILLENGGEPTQLSRVDQIIHETTQTIIKIKRMLKERQKLYNSKSGANLGKIAELSSKVDLEMSNVDKDVETIEKELILYQNKQLNEEQQQNYDKLKQQRQLIITSKKTLQEWLAVENQNQEISQFSNISNIMKKQKEDQQKIENNVAQQLVNQQTNQADLDELLPQFKDIDEAVSEVKKQDEKLENTAASMIPKVKQIAAQVERHKELLDIQKEQMTDIQQNMKQTTEKVKSITATTEDVQKRLLKGDKCLTIIIIVLIVLIAVYWIFKIIL